MTVRDAESTYSVILPQLTLNHQIFVQIVMEKGNSESALVANLPDIAPSSAKQMIGLPTRNSVKQFSHSPD